MKKPMAEYNEDIADRKAGNRAKVAFGIIIILAMLSEPFVYWVFL